MPMRIRIDDKFAQLANFDEISWGHFCYPHYEREKKPANDHQGNKL